MYTFAVSIEEAIMNNLLLGDYQIIDDYFDFYGHEILILRKKWKMFSLRLKIWNKKTII